MNLSLFKLKPADLALSQEADELEAQFGPAGAVQHIREQIAGAGRGARQHLYRLHDEIVRRHPAAIATAA
jgi:hypothetical protein